MCFFDLSEDRLIKEVKILKPVLWPVFFVQTRFLFGKKERMEDLNRNNYFYLTDRRICEQKLIKTKPVRPDSAKFCYFGENVQGILRVYLVLGKSCHLLWQKIYNIEQFFIAVNGQ